MSKDLPFVSIIVPMRNEERHIERCIKSLAAQDYPSDRFEVIVVDGGSDDRSREIVESLRGEFSSLRLVENRDHQTARGLNVGLAYAEGDIIARLDGHAIAQPDFLRESVAALQRTSADVVGGPISSQGEGATGEAIALAMSSPFGVGNATFRYGTREEWTDTVAFPAYRRDVFDRFGLFAEIEAGEDDELHFRVRDGGGRILLTPNIRSTYFGRPSFWELAKQYFAYGQAKVVVLSRHPRRTRLRHLAPLALIVALAASAIAAAFGGLMVLPLVALTALYLTASVGVSIRIARHHGWPHAIRLPVAFACMHIAYGLGFFSALLRRSFGRPVAVPREAEAR